MILSLSKKLTFLILVSIFYFFTLSSALAACGVTPDLLDTVKGSRLSCTRSDFAFQEQSAGQHDYNLQTIPVEV